MWGINTPNKPTGLHAFSIRTRSIRAAESTVWNNQLRNSRECCMLIEKCLRALIESASKRNNAE